MGRFFEIVYLLLQAVAKKDAERNSGRTVLGHLSESACCWRQAPTRTSQTTRGGVHSLDASITRRAGILQILLQAGASKDMVDNNGRTALWAAFSRGLIDIVCLLLEAIAERGRQ